VQFIGLIEETKWKWKTWTIGCWFSFWFCICNEDWTTCAVL